MALSATMAIIGAIRDNSFAAVLGFSGTVFGWILAEVFEYYGVQNG